MKESPMKGLLFWTILPLTVWAVYWNLNSLFLTALAAALLLGSLTSFYIPSRYSLDAQGASLHRWFIRKRLDWTRVRSVVDEQGGLFLSPFPLKSRLENFRGMFLPYRDNRQAVIDWVKLHAPEAKGFKPEQEDGAPYPSNTKNRQEDGSPNPSEKENQ
jgi:hypothetical protein